MAKKTNRKRKANGLINARLAKEFTQKTSTLGTKTVRIMSKHTMDKDD